MKATLTAVLGVALGLIAGSAAARPPTGTTPRVRIENQAGATTYDCREVVKVRTVTGKAGRKVKLWEIRECPHRDKMAAGKCVESFWWGMRCRD